MLVGWGEGEGWGASYFTHPPFFAEPQRCGLTRVCSAATEADVIVVIEVTSTTLNDPLQ